ncbi:DUF1212-domain-containing protein [Mycena olivaceomarginata]|nr:DUF1212-domain-containing protein [Mycena olivaceomarginata]
MAMAGAKPPLPGIMTGHDSPRGATGSKTPRKPSAFQTLTTALERPPVRVAQPSHPASTTSRRGAARFPPSTPTTRPRILRLPSPRPRTASSPPHRHRPTEVPGNYIGPQEDAGLPARRTSRTIPAAPRTRSCARTRRARGSSAALALGGMPRSKRAREGGDDYNSDYTRAHSWTASSDVEQDLHSAELTNPALGGGGGLLSALLTLYNDAGPPRARPPQPHPPGYRGAARAAMGHPPPAAKTFSSLAQVDEDERAPGTARTSPSERGSSTPPSPRADPVGRSHPRSGSQSSLAKFHLLPSKKPRNGGYGNISGVAAPVPSQLAPNIKRPGGITSRGILCKRMMYQRLLSHAGTPEEHAPDQRTVDARPQVDVDDVVRGGHAVEQAWVDGEAERAAARDVWWAERTGTPVQTPSSGTDRDEWIDEKWLRDQEHRKEKRRKRKKAEVYRQEFILKLARALMMFGGPSHRLQAQIQSTGRVLDIQSSSASTTFDWYQQPQFIRQGSSLCLGKLNEVYELYWSVIHDEQSVSEASSTLDALMRGKQEYTWWQLVLIGGFCSMSICSLLSIRNELLEYLRDNRRHFFSFISAVLASTGFFCYSAVASSSVVLILPGFIVLCGSLEIMSRNIVAGSVRMCYAVVYSLFLGFGLAIGAEAYEKITSKTIIGSTDYSCSISHDAHGPWYQRTPSLYWGERGFQWERERSGTDYYFLFDSVLDGARVFAVLEPAESGAVAEQGDIAAHRISCIGWVTNHFSGVKFKDQSDITAAVGAFTVGFVSNVYARFFSGNAFVIMITGILFQLPSGLGNGGLLTYASEKTAGNSTSYLSGFQTALQLISVAIGLTVGLGLALAVVHPIQSRPGRWGVQSLSTHWATRRHFANLYHYQRTWILT